MKTEYRLLASLHRRHNKAARPEPVEGSKRAAFAGWPFSVRVLMLLFVLTTVLLSACRQDATVLIPEQVDSSRVNQVVKVKGKVEWVNLNPAGLGGAYIEIESTAAQVGVRIQEDEWQKLDDRQKAQFKVGNTITVEGVVFQAGRVLVIIYGKSTLPPPGADMAPAAPPNEAK